MKQYELELKIKCHILEQEGIFTPSKIITELKEKDITDIKLISEVFWNLYENNLIECVCYTLIGENKYKSNLPVS